MCRPLSNRSTRKPKNNIPKPRRGVTRWRPESLSCPCGAWGDPNSAWKLSTCRSAGARLGRVRSGGETPRLMGGPLFPSDLRRGHEPGLGATGKGMARKDFVLPCSNKPSADSQPFGVRWQGGQGGATPLWQEGTSPQIESGVAVRPCRPPNSATALHKTEPVATAPLRFLGSKRETLFWAPSPLPLLRRGRGRRNRRNGAPWEAPK